MDGLSSLSSTPELAQADYWRQLAAQLDATPHGGRAALLVQAGQHMGVASSTVYRELAAVGWRSGRKPRVDSGSCHWNRAEALAVATLMRVSERENDKRLLSVADATAMALANGLIRSPLSESAAHAAMRRYGVHPVQMAAPPPHQPLASRHPNHYWQVDASICVLYWMTRGGLGVMEKRLFNKNKPEHFKRVENDRVLRYVVTDHCTGAFLLRYYVGAGERQEFLFDVLAEAMTERPGEPFHGVPFMLGADKGSAMSHMLRHWLGALRVELVTHAPGNARAKGSVEKTHDLVERGFEGRLKYLPITSLDQLNLAADTWRQAFCAKALHSRHGMSRWAAWQRIQPTELRLAPPRAVLDALLTAKEDTRVVRGDLTVSYRVKGFASEQYSVAHVPGVRVEERVTITWNPYRAPNIDVITVSAEGHEQRWECTPLPQDDAWGFSGAAQTVGDGYHRQADTAADQARKESLRLAYGSDTLAGAERQRASRAPAFGGRVDPIGYLANETRNLTHLPRAGTDLPINRVQIEERPIGVVETVRRLKAMLGADVPDGLYMRIASAYPDGVAESALESVAACLRDEMTPTAAPRLVAVK